MELRQQEAALPSCLAVALETRGRQESMAEGQVGSTAACARPASTLSAVQWWELNLPTRQTRRSTPALPARAGILPVTPQPRAPCGNTALETALPCASFCAADPWNQGASLEKWGFPPLPSPPLFIGTKEQKIASTPSDSVLWRSWAGSGALGEHLYLEFLNCNQKSYIPWHCWEAAGGMKCYSQNSLYCRAIGCTENGNWLGTTKKREITNLIWKMGEGFELARVLSYSSTLLPGIWGSVPSMKVSRVMNSIFLWASRARATSYSPRLSFSAKPITDVSQGFFIVIILF